MKISELDKALRESREPLNKCIVRLTTSAWHDGTGVYLKKSLVFLKRKCVGYNILYEDCNNCTPIEIIDKIDNLYDCKDGIYRVTTCNEFAAWETPNIIEDYDYKLVPIESV